MEAASNSAQLPTTCAVDAPAKKSKRRRPYGVKKPRPFTREQLDQRTAAYRLYTSLYSAVESEAGGADQLSAVQRQLVEAFCIVSVQLNDMSARALAGEEDINLNLTELSLAASTLTRLASRIGLRRVPRTLDQYLSKRKAIADHDIAQRLDDLHGK